MKRRVGLLLVLMWLAVPNGAVGEEVFLKGSEHLADYNAELRGSDGRVDVTQLVARLKQLQVDTYYYLIWHRETDWEDLKLFLPAAQEAGINVWVYLVPPSESPPIYGTWYSEPFRLDYVRWGEEIGRLSLEHPNLTAFVIDDFWSNHNFYTPEYVRQMRDRARAINPNMRFLPLMYYPEIDRAFVEDYGGVIDGVVVAYPKSPEEIQQAWHILNDRQSDPARWVFAYPWQTPSAIGEQASMRRRVEVLPGGTYEIRINQRDDFVGPTTGYHFKELLIDGEVVWEEDVAGGNRIWQEVVVDVSQQVLGKQEVEVMFRVDDRLRVSNFGVVVEVQEPEFEGLKLLDGQGWEQAREGRWSLAVAQAYNGEDKFQIPQIVMIAANRSQFIKRNGEPASVERMRAKVQMAISQMREGFASGVVTYALYKDIRDEVYGAIWQLYLKARRSGNVDFDGNGVVNFNDFLLFASSFGRQIGHYDSADAAYDLNFDGVVDFGDFVLFAQVFGQ